MEKEVEMKKEMGRIELYYWGCVAIVLIVLTAWDVWTRPVDCAATDVKTIRNR